MHIQNLVKFYQFVLKILSGNEIMTEGMTDNPFQILYKKDSYSLSIVCQQKIHRKYQVLLVPQIIVKILTVN